MAGKRRERVGGLWRWCFDHWSRLRCVLCFPKVAQIFVFWFIVLAKDRINCACAGVLS